MTLQFDPSPYLAAFQYGQNRDQHNRDVQNQTLQGASQNIGQGIEQLAQIPGQQRDARMQQLMTAMKLKEQGIDPTNAMSWAQTGKFPSAPQDNTSTSPAPMFGQPQVPSDSGADTQTAPSIPQQEPSGFSDTISRWKQATATPNHPFLPQSGSSSAPNNMPQQPTGFGSLFKSVPTIKDRLAESEIAKNNADAALKTKKEMPATESTTPVSAVVAMFPHLKDQRSALEKEFPNGLTDKHLSLVAAGQKIDATLGTKDSQQQDKLEKDYRQQILSLRGDKSLQNMETQRDAATMAYNRIKQIEATGKPMNPVDYVDILGLVYKARTGAAPTNEVLSSAKQDTAKGQLGKWYTWATGQQAPATTSDIQNSLLDMVGHMGKQADDMHEAYMAPHLLAPEGLDEARAARIRNTTRGKSFRDATGYTEAPATVQGGGMKVGRFLVTAAQ